MNYTENTNKKKRIVPKGKVQIIVKREFVGEKSLTDVFIPIIYDDIRKKLENGDTFDCPTKCA